MKTAGLFFLGVLTSCGTAPRDPAQGLFDRLDADGSGDLVQGELASRQPARILQSMDTDGNGSVDLEEFRADLERYTRPTGAPRP
jgi:Ca2+-binding EF-hand superfamily protein